MTVSAPWWKARLPSGLITNRFLAERQSLMGSDLYALREESRQIHSDIHELIDLITVAGRTVTLTPIGQPTRREAND